MKRILLTLLTTYLAISHTNCVPFCDIQSIDNVFNVGHLIYMTRCGEVWTYDPRMDGGTGGFLRDYTVYTFARRHFAANIQTQFGEYKKEYLRFAAFSFQEVNCLNSDEDLKKSCANSVDKWNSLSLIVDNKTAVTFRYDTELIFDEKGSDNPMNFKGIQNITDKNRNKFWPDITVVAKDQFPGNTEKGFIHSGLFNVDKNQLFIALRHDKYYCVTLLNMNLMLHNVSEWPSASGSKYRAEDWTKASCFTGNLVGMFYDTRTDKSPTVYIVGRVAYDSRKFEDQIYRIESGSSERVTWSEVKDNRGEPHNLRTWFGCKPQSNGSPNTRRKRSIKRVKKEHVREMVKIDNNWIQMALLSAVVLMLIYGVYRYSTDNRFRARILKSD